jgi:outer membrane protein
MKRVLLGFIMTALSIMTAGGAAGENLEGRLGITARLGFALPSDSSWNGSSLSGDMGFTGGGGLLFGVTKNVAIEVEATATRYDLKNGSFVKDGTATVTNLSFNGLYHFAEYSKASPYLGGGLSILFNDYTNADVDTVMGVNLKGGLDYFITHQIALNMELKGVISPTATMRDLTGTYTSGSFDPTSFSCLFGARYLFN